MASDSFSAKGCFEDMSNMGFKDTDCIREGGIENQLDAKSPEIQISLNKSQILFADSGPGMVPDQLKMSRRLFNRKDATDEKNGCFGIGGSVASSQLTRLGGKAIRLSKVEGGPLNQLTLDYPSIVKHDKYELHVHEATKAMHDLWDKHAINKEHGTLDILECPQAVVDDMVAKLPHENLGRMYADYLAEGIKITILSDGKVLLNLKAEDINDEPNATTCEKYEVHIWVKGASMAVQFKNGKGQLVYVDAIGGKQLTDDLLKKGFKKVGVIACTSSLRFSLPKNDGNWKAEQGGYFLKRVKKIVEKYSIVFPNSGDFSEREIKAASRHVWKFPTSLDPWMGVEINKSRINRGNVHPLIYDVLETLADKFSGKFWKSIKPKPVVAPVHPTGNCARCHHIPCACDSVSERERVLIPPAPTGICRKCHQVHCSCVVGIRVITGTCAKCHRVECACVTATGLPKTAPKPVEKKGAPVNTVVEISPPAPTPAPTPTPTPTGNKPSVVDVPAHQKLVPQSHRDLVMAMIDVKVKLAHLNLNDLLHKAPITTEGGVASKIQVIQEVIKLLEQISK